MEGGGQAGAAADAPSTRPTNGRSSANQFAVNRDSRKPLFGTPGGKNNRARKKEPARSAASGLGIQNRGTTATARPTSSASVDSKSDRSLSNTPQGTRIPRPTTAGAALSHPRRPITLMDAYRMAEEEEEKERMSSPAGPDLSPSPAPRPWLSRHESDENKMRQMLNRGPIDSKGRSRRSSTKSMESGKSAGLRRSDSMASQNSASTTGSFDQRFSEFEQAQEGSPKSKAGLFSKSRIGPKVARVGEALARKASNSSLDSSSKSPSNSIGRSNSSRRSGSGWLRRLVSMEGEREEAIEEDEVPDKDIPIPSVESGRTPQEPTPPTSWPTSRPTSAPVDDLADHSPNKSYAWQVDAEFTAGDLQFSDSPRIRVDSHEDLVQRKNQHEEVPQSKPRPSLDRPRSANTKLDEIRAREAQIENEFPLPDASKPRQPNTKLDEIRARELEIDDLVPLPDKKERPRNTKLDEIRAREIEFLSKRALATSRLDEIRERNAHSRSRSPEDLQDRALSREQTPFYDAESANGKSALEGEPIPNTPITVYRKTAHERTSRRDMSADNKEQKSSRNSSGSRSGTNNADEPRDLLRQLARAASSSPGAEASTGKEGTTEKPEPDSKPAKPKSSMATRPNNGRKPTPPEAKEPEAQRPTVGFVGLRRVQSTESTHTKRSSMAHSDSDPTERIEREMQLFAPMENQSEKGSIRAPSPVTSDDEDPFEETPRARKIDPLTMSTPRVTGAYVETPATAKPDRPETAASLSVPAATAAASAAATLLRNKIPGAARSRQDKVDSDPESRPTRTRASGPRRRRAKSLPKRSHPLVNSAKPPTVKDDLLELLRTHNIDDSTLDDFGELLALQRAVSPDSAELEEVAKIKDESDSDRDNKQSEREREMEAYNRMTRSLKTGLLEIRSAKQGIERLEDKVSHSDGDQIKSEDAKPQVDHTAVGHHCAACANLPASNNAVAYILIPIPRLYHRRPFRLTLLGLILSLFIAWYMAETATCNVYCRPETCSTTPCIWSPEDPTFGTALPSKLDQWTTGGQGRRLVARLSEDVEDLLADAWDFATGADIRQIDPSTLDFYERRQYRRRLRKKGLAKKRKEPRPEDRAKWNVWRQAKLENEKRKAAREMGYDDGGDTTLGSDERIW